MFSRQVFAVFMSLFFSCAAISQKNEVSIVSGKLDFIGQENRILSVTYRKIGGGFEFDSSLVHKGQFRIEKKVSEPLIAVMMLKPLEGAPRQNHGVIDYISVLLMPGNTLAIHGADNLRSATFSGTGANANQDYQDYVAQLNRYIDTINRSAAYIRSLTLDSAEKAGQITRMSDSIKLLRDQQVALKFVMSKPESPVAAIALLDYAGEPVWTPRKKMNPEEIEKLLNQLPKRFSAYPTLLNLREELQVSKATGYGKPIIDFSLEDTSGKMVRLSDFKGKYVFLDFWASWCAPCRRENPNVKKQFEKYKDKGFTVVSVSLDKPEAKQVWLEAIRKDQIGLWTQLGDLDGFDGKVAKSYYVKSIPTNFLIDPDGKFLGRNLYGEVLNKALEKVFNNKY